MIGERPLYRGPSPGCVLPRSARPSYWCPSLNSDIHRNSPDSCPTCARNAAPRAGVFTSNSASAASSKGRYFARISAPKCGNNSARSASDKLNTSDDLVPAEFGDAGDEADDGARERHNFSKSCNNDDMGFQWLDLGFEDVGTPHVLLERGSVARGVRLHIIELVFDALESVGNHYGPRLIWCVLRIERMRSSKDGAGAGSGFGGGCGSQGEALPASSSPCNRRNMR